MYADCGDESAEFALISHTHLLIKYCNIQEECTNLPLRMERECRQKISGVVQRILLLFRAAHCSFPAAQWYIIQLKWARKIMQKVGF